MHPIFAPWSPTNWRSFFPLSLDYGVARVGKGREQDFLLQTCYAGNPVVAQWDVDKWVVGMGEGRWQARKGRRDSGWLAARRG